MHLAPTGREQEVAVVFDVDRCGVCGQSFRRLGTYRPSTRRCHAHDRYHWELACKTGGHTTPDERCDATVAHHPLEGHGH